MAAGHLGPREPFLTVERWKTVQVMGIVDRLYFESALFFVGMTATQKVPAPVHGVLMININSNK